MPRRRPDAIDDIPSTAVQRDGSPDDTGYVAEEPSKSEMKRRMHALQELGEDVAALPAERLAGLAIEERLRDAITELARTRSHEGRRRQMQYIGKLMKFEDAQALREAVAAWRLGSARETLALHEAEAWRDRLLADDDALAAWMNAHPDTDSQQLRSLVRAARKDAGRPDTRHGRPYRDLFQMVKRHLQALS